MFLFSRAVVKKMLPLTHEEMVVIIDSVHKVSHKDDPSLEITTIQFHTADHENSQAKVTEQTFMNAERERERERERESQFK